jgi:pyridoxamine 5'-phosphate oxidase
MKERSHKDLGKIRREYALDTLDESRLPDDPMILFETWLDQAHKSGHPDPTAMTLTTLEEDGKLSSRMVLLKGIQLGKLLFFTNYESRKARAIGSRPGVAVHFYWPGLERQVKISGRAEVLEEAESDRYFQSRPFESQIAAWASPQSREIPHREFLENEFLYYQEKHRGGSPVPRPPFWGGFAITPSHMEFWQGGKHRLHDRIEYRLENVQWSRVRLAP